MSGRTASKPWTEEEDLLLRQAVAQHGEFDNWKTVALSVPGRNNKSCRKRWLHSLQPNIKKSIWTLSEDQLLLDLFASLGPKWSAIARQIPGRTDDACSKRYREALDPNLKKDEWTDEEDALLLKVYNEVGQKWGQIGLELTRSGLGCRNRWRLLERKRLSQLPNASKTVSAQESAVVEPPPQSFLLQEDAPHVHWPPYYPPEAYTTFFSDENQPGESSLREPSPEALHISDPYVAPFQSSSSSLSAALSDPPRPPPSLPPLSAFNTPELLVHDIPNEGERQTSLSPLSQCNAILEMSDDTLMSPECQTHGAMEQGAQIAVPQLPCTPDPFINLRQLSDCDVYTASPFMVSSDILRNQDPNYIWKPRGIPDTDYDSPRSTFNGSILYEVHDACSSVSSTPFAFSPTALSPGPSPVPGPCADLPNAEEPSSNSLLFSPAHASSTRRPRKHTSSRKTKATLKSPVPTRLSATLPLSTNPNVRPYACGRPQCWPSTAITSTSCYTTSGDLLDHIKDQHPEEEVAEKPYRCALPGCGKSWKSINGLQYHLQISTAHFSSALSSRLNAQIPSTPDLRLGTSLRIEGEIEDSEPERKYACPRFGCYKAYRQHSGLKYHIQNGHPTDIPTQLALVPPALERQIPNKAKKLRPKLFPESVAS